MCYTEANRKEKRTLMKFNELELIEPLIEAVNQMNYKEASPIQQQAIPVLLEGHDLSLIHI